MTRPSLQSDATDLCAYNSALSGVPYSFRRKQDGYCGRSASSPGGPPSICVERLADSAGNPDRQPFSYCAIFVCALADTRASSSTSAPSPEDKDETACHKPNIVDVSPQNTPRPSLVIRMPLSVSMQRWVSSESTQTGGSVFGSIGGSILASVKEQ